MLWKAQPSGQSIEGSLCRAGHGTRPDQRDFPGQIGMVGNYVDEDVSYSVDKHYFGKLSQITT